MWDLMIDLACVRACVCACAYAVSVHVPIPVSGAHHTANGKI